MNGFITKPWVTTLPAAVLAGSLLASGGCIYHDLIDPCWPERYISQARHEVLGAFEPQVQNGHVLDQTVWNYHFEPGTDQLTPGGTAHLAYLARRRPAPDPTIYLQVSQDVAYDPANPAKFAEARKELDNKRIASVQKYLNAQTAGRNVAFNVVPHDPPDVSVSAIEQSLATQQMRLSSQGVLRLYGGGTRGAGGP